MVRPIISALSGVRCRRRGLRIGRGGVRRGASQSTGAVIVGHCLHIARRLWAARRLARVRLSRHPRALGEPMTTHTNNDASSGRERISQAAYELFSRDGTQSVGIDAVIAHAGAAKMTLYRNFRSKDELILDFLRRREQLWTRDWLQAEAQKRGHTPQARLLAI